MSDSEGWPVPIGQVDSVVKQDFHLMSPTAEAELPCEGRNHCVMRHQLDQGQIMLSSGDCNSTIR
jgi:hypothetical protein